MGAAAYFCAASQPGAVAWLAEKVLVAGVVARIAWVAEFIEAHAGDASIAADALDGARKVVNPPFALQAHVPGRVGRHISPGRYGNLVWVFPERAHDAVFWAIAVADFCGVASEYAVHVKGGRAACVANAFYLRAQRLKAAPVLVVKIIAAIERISQPSNGWIYDPIGAVALVKGKAKLFFEDAVVHFHAPGPEVRPLPPAHHFNHVCLLADVVCAPADAAGRFFYKRALAPAYRRDVPDV